MAAHPQHSTDGKEPKEAGCAQVGYPHQGTHYPCSTETLGSDRKPAQINEQTEAFCGPVSQQNPFTYIQQSAKAGNRG